MSSTTMRVIVIGLMVLSILPLASGCCTIAGGLLGGGTGAVVGAGAGLLVGQPVEGLKGGAAVGALAGGVTGAMCDALILSPFTIVGHVLGCNKSHEALSAKDVEKLCEAGVDEQVIITQIEQVGMQGPLSVKEIVRLQKQGVSSVVIQVAQQHPAPITQPQEVPADEPQVVSDAPQFATSESTEPLPVDPSVTTLQPPNTASTSEIAPFFEQAPYTQPYAQPDPAVQQ